MAESIIRHQVANLNLTEVIANRHLLRNKVRSEMLDVVKGWGMWLETVEVTDVQILSGTVFNDLQSKYRESTHLQAEQKRLQTATAIELQKLAHQMEMDEIRSKSETEQAKKQLWTELAIQKESAKVKEESLRMEMEQLERQKAVAMQEALNRAELNATRQMERMKVRRMHAEAELKRIKERIEVERNMPPATLQRKLMQATADIYSQLPLSQMQLFSSESTASLSELLPGLSHLHEEINK
eukprot:NODE_1867_length_1046_cov_189.637914_g1518_i0.p1 GENE.NODE_1867_length_1046_cov_189.637914_g1518_i0~~NODE_1867_length_1046_cov_189.637914_g1518_i0.p1  ORF type:complete len:270 (-),score=86.31 NODE_1867_length_1046_cov_189.637914_g1518_i0:236-958(-)